MRGGSREWQEKDSIKVEESQKVKKGLEDYVVVSRSLEIKSSEETRSQIPVS